jgi:ABC-type phosphate/phosphonate transport system substrate-binding protein
MKTTIRTVAGVMLVGLLFVPRPAAGQGRPPHVSLRVGLVDTLFRTEGDKEIQSLAGPFRSLMEENANIGGDVVNGGDFDHVAGLLKEGKVKIGVFHGFEFAWARLKNPDLKPVMIAVNQQPSVRVVLVVRQDSKATTPADLKGKALNLPQLAREQCRLFVERRCVQEGVSPEKWFAKIKSPRTAQDALDDVDQKYADAAVVEEVDLAAFKRKFPKTAARLRVLAESEKFPSPVIACQAGGVGEDVLIRLRSGLIAARNTDRGRKLLESCYLTGFEEVPADYEQQLQAILKAYPRPGK